jgi:hypothetical protein
MGEPTPTHCVFATKSLSRFFGKATPRTTGHLPTTPRASLRRRKQPHCAHSRNPQFEGVFATQEATSRTTPLTHNHTSVFATKEATSLRETHNRTGVFATKEATSRTTGHSPTTRRNIQLKAPFAHQCICIVILPTFKKPLVMK